MQIIADRRALHQIPELDQELPKTIAYLQASLAELSCRVFSPAEGSLCAFFDFGKEDAIAFRSDADALPVTERTNAPYASCHVGKMHACGHDGHMAILLELARRLNKKTQLPHNVLLIFQCAEETTGGAKAICQSGVLEKYRVRAVFGLHLWPKLEEGVVFSRKREMMARTCNLGVEILGRSAHIAMANQALDATAAAVEFYTKAAQLEQALPENVYRLLKFGMLQSGTVGNAISCRAELRGALRAFQDEIFEGLRDGLYEIARQVEESSGCTVELQFHEGYPAVMNPEDLFGKVEKILPVRQLDTPSMTAEDFSYYQKAVPGMFFFLGLGDVPPLHADTFHFNEEILVKGADFFEMLAERFE